MGKSLGELASYFRPLAELLIANCEAVGVPVRVVDTGRTAEEQKEKLAHGVSWTAFSKHLPQPPEGKSEAIDIVPLSVLEENKLDWNPSSPAWLMIGEIGVDLGLRWGGHWVHRDPSHFEWQKPSSTVPGVEESVV